MTKVVEMMGITKAFPGVVANRALDFELEEGEVHGLLGENGAGKTTLMNILYGLCDMDEGKIKINGQMVTIRNSRNAIDLGLGMVHQHFQFVPRFTVAENFLLGMQSPHEPLLEDRHQVYARIREFSKQYQLPVDPARLMWQLSVGEQQRVEILRALYRGAQILILDEPTSVLTPQEVTQLADILQNMISMGKSVIFITHKLEEVMMMTQRVTVLRDGEVIGTLTTKDTNRSELARMMVGREIGSPPPRIEVPGTDEPILRVESLHVADDRGLPAVRGISFKVKTGEILGIAGIDGNGQIELEESIVGLRPLTSGRLFLMGHDVTYSTVRQRRRSLAYIPSDRYLRGVIRDFTVAENLVLGKHLYNPFSNKRRLEPQIITNHSEQLVEEYQIRTPSVTTAGGKLSGGNAQRLILARELSDEPTAILACQPTRGLDVGATEYVHKQLLEQRNRGTAILLISADLEEIMTLSDRIAVIFEGQIMGTRVTGQADVETLGLLMAGVSDTK